jgi:hypothetical protein
MRLRTGHRLLVVSAALVPHIALLGQQAVGGAPNACRRTSPSHVRILLRIAPQHTGSLVVAPNGELKLRMKTGVDPCNGTVAEIDSVGLRGSSRPDTLILDRRNGLGGARLRFDLFWQGGRDTFLLLGTRARDRIRAFQFESSSPWLEEFRWDSVGSGRTFDLERMKLVGRSGADFLVGKPSGTGPFTRRTHIRLLTRGGPGPDRAIGGRRGDRIRGGFGNDFLGGGPGPDTLWGGSGRDICRGGKGVDVLRGCEA